MVRSPMAEVRAAGGRLRRLPATGRDGRRPSGLLLGACAVRQATGWGDTQLRVHLGRLEQLEYILGRRDGGRVVYELLWSGEGQDAGPFVMGLIDVDALEGAYDGEVAGSEGQVAGSSRAERGGTADGHFRENPQQFKALEFKAAQMAGKAYQQEIQS